MCNKYAGSCIKCGTEVMPTQKVTNYNQGITEQIVFIMFAQFSIFKHW